MTSIENYSKIIESIFGVGKSTFSILDTHSNHVIGALNDSNNYKKFTSNFLARLTRLNSIYLSYPDYMKEILVQVNEVASKKNWEGAFAELTAYDFLNSDKLNQQNYLSHPIQPNVTLPSISSLSSELGKHETNLDGFISDYNLYFDVKSFKDNITEILEGIYSDLKKHLGVKNIHIIAEHALDSSYEDIKSKRSQLLNELMSGITTTGKETYFSSKVISNLSFRILWGKGIQITERTYDPYSHAENFHKTIFNYANKFMKSKPTVILLVVFPWYNHIITDFSNSNKEFYRAFSRRVFCQYKNDISLFKTFNTKFTGNQTIYEISKHLSGIIFLEDNCILSNDPSLTNINSFVYPNPNAINSISKSLSYDFIRALSNSSFDDFEHDNY